ncbi:MAG TPA: acyl-CoA dehydrogenase, partial [Arenibacter sp.]|nr:acyl-CoA dehydrogenase [Arenibacter sp.]
IQEAANNHLPGYAGLTQGAAELIVHFANESLKKTYVPKMLSGAWGGTMCLTEPQAGSSLSDITTKATPTQEGYYKISGQKIFISGGDHQYAENVVHLLLARIEGAPSGTKGISLFVVPKLRMGKDGSLTNNDVMTVADFQKMGQRGYATTHLGFGDKDDCHGWLVGQAHKGLKYMFLMMNSARISVGRGG